MKITSLFNGLLLTTNLFLCANNLSAQYISSVTVPDPNAVLVDDINLDNVKYAHTITAEDMKKQLFIIASEKMAGRETGYEGNVLAGEYISEQLKSWGVKPAPGMKDYFQPIALTYTSWDKSELKLEGKAYRHLWDYLSLPGKNNEIPSQKIQEVLFLGYGIDERAFNDYSGKKVKGKAIMINEGEPMMSDSISKLTGTTQMSDWTLEKKIELAHQKGVEIIFIVPKDLKTTLNDNRRSVLSPMVDLDNTVGKKIDGPNVIYISSSLARDIMGEKGVSELENARVEMDEKGKFKQVVFTPDLELNFTKNQKLIEGRNIIAYFEGSSKTDETVIISAHYDHIGKRGDVTYFGADDNGTGTTTLLEFAEALSKAEKDHKLPARNIMLLWMTGEEKGLLGSKYYAEHPVIPIKNTIVDVNIDMIGRQDKKYKEKNEKYYIYTIGSDRLSQDLHEVNEEINKKYSGLILDYTFNSESDPNRFYYRSDHYNFAQKGIPAIFFFSGVHEDYHQPGDTPDKIMYDKMERIGRHAFQLMWELANRPDRIRVNP